MNIACKLYDENCACTKEMWMVIGRGYFFCLPVHTVKNVTSACRLMVKGLIIIIITIIIHLLRGGLHQRKRFWGGPLVENIETNTGNFKNLLEQRLRMSNKKISRNYYLGSRKRFPCSHSPILTREGSGEFVRLSRTLPTPWEFISGYANTGKKSAIAFIN